MFVCLFGNEIQWNLSEYPHKELEEQKHWTLICLDIIIQTQRPYLHLPANTATHTGCQFAMEGTSFIKLTNDWIVK